MSLLQIQGTPYHRHRHTDTQTHRYTDRHMMRRKSPLSESMLYLIENHCQTNTSKGRRGKSVILFS